MNNKLKNVIYIVLFIVFIIGFIYFGTLDYTKDDDTEKFSQEHTIVQKDNNFKYVTSKDVLGKVKEDNVIMLFGIKNSVWVDYYAKLLNEVVKENNIETVYYYDIDQDRIDNNAVYESIVNLLDNHITVLDNGVKDIYTPALLIKKNGEVLYFDDETAFVKNSDTLENYWTEEKTNNKKLELTNIITLYIGE